MDLLGVVVVGIVCTVSGVVGGLVSSHVVLSFVRNAEAATTVELKKVEAFLASKEQEVKKAL